MRRTFPIFTVIFILLFSVVSLAESGHCRCGRILTDAGLCSVCGHDSGECDCKCWCGSSTSVIITENGNILVCDDCGSVCNQCTCADRAVAMRLEEMNNDGSASLTFLPKSKLIAEIAVLVVFLLVFAVVLWAFAVQKTEETIEKELERKKKRRSHSEIMNKIEGLVSSGDERKKKSGGRLTAEANLKWNIEDCSVGIIAYELTNAVAFHRSEGGTLTDITFFLLGSQLDADGTLESAFKGAYGKTSEFLAGVYMAARSTDGSQIKAARSYFEEGFFERNEKSLGDILWDTSVDNTSIHQLLKLPFRMTFAVGACEPQLTRYAKKRCSEYASADVAQVSYLKRHRFPVAEEWEADRR